MPRSRPRRNKKTRNLLEILQEWELNATQPLVDFGWRVDYERMGISRPDTEPDFISLSDLRRMVEALPSPSQEVWPIPSLPPDDANGGHFLMLEDLEDAVGALPAAALHRIPAATRPA
jgi:hypothetical protein